MNELSATEQRLRFEAFPKSIRELYPKNVIVHEAVNAFFHGLITRDEAMEAMIIALVNSSEKWKLELLKCVNNSPTITVPKIDYDPPLPTP